MIARSSLHFLCVLSFPFSFCSFLLTYIPRQRLLHSWKGFHGRAAVFTGKGAALTIDHSERGDITPPVVEATFVGSLIVVPIENSSSTINRTTRTNQGHVHYLRAVRCTRLYVRTNEKGSSSTSMSNLTSTLTPTRL